jgi:hypothetical protein
MLNQPPRCPMPRSEHRVLVSVKRDTAALVVLMVMAAGLGPADVLGSVFMSASTLRTSATDGVTSGVTDNALLPWMHVRTVTQGASTAITTYDFTVNGSDVTFLTSFDHARGGQSGNAAMSFGFFSFGVLEDLIYTLEGSYASTGGGITSLEVSLEDQASGDLFHNLQRSSSASAHSFVLGQQAGDQQNVLAGDMTGVLLAGRSYALHHWYEIVETPGLGSASAAGSLRLHLTPVPEPTTLALAVPAAMLVFRRRRRWT